MVNPGKTETCNGIDDDCSGMKDDCHGLENDCCDYCYAEAGDGSSTAVWRPDLPAAGTYRVYAKWVAHADNTTAARYTIFFEGGSQDVLVNQRMGEGEWHLLGIWTFAAGTIGSVVLHNDTADGKVIADSVKFVLWDDPNPGIEIISYHENAVLGGPWTCELYCRDDDNDGFGKCPDCGIVYGCILDGNDCNDKNASINPAATEVCDGVDNNCNGVIDEGLGTTTCGVGACQVTISNCIDGVPQVCVPLSPTAEICDGIDNDCNGVIDDGLTRPTSCGVGACAGNTGIETCSAGTWGNNTCNPFAGATAEICDGVDNNCNGAVDEGLTRPTTCGVGACAGNTGTETCTAGTWGNNTCNPLAGASAEICDGIDNDCNGVIDDGLTRPTSCGVGACAGNTGIETCSAGTWGNNTCNPFAGATAEICDGIDDDCDGVIPANEADTDGDGIRDCNDNCPNVRNPDQRNVDGDINGDMCDICPADSSDTCDINKSASCSIGASGGTCATTDGSITIIIPPGALDSETSLSITGIGSEYELSTNQGQATALYGLNIQPEGLQFLAPVTMIFRWNDTDNDGKIDSTNIKEEHLLITKNNNALTGRCGQDAGCDMAANTFTFQVLGLSEFVLLVLNNEPAVGNISSQLPDDPLETPRQVNTEIDVIASFTDTGFTDSHTAAWDWGDGSTDPGTVNEAGGTGTVSGAHIYAAPGVYTVTLTVTDDDGLVGTGLFQYIVVYDPDGGFVTGGGWINSPTGAYVPDPSLTGKANFGFVSKYKKGATVPTGNTEFQFKVADLNFHSDTYQWLVIAGAKAQYKGTGTINDEGNYGFMLKAIDGDIKGGGGVDKFRIKIWDKDTNDEIVYDNQLGDSDDADPATVIGGGSIVIHK
jgi:PKD repeat protein